MTASTGARPLFEPVLPTSPSAAGTTGHGITPRRPRPAGDRAMAVAVAAQHAVHPRPRALELLRRVVGADPLAAGALEPYVDAIGQREVGRRLAVLRHRSGPTPPWHVVHDLPLQRATDDTADDTADHVLVGPGGVYAVTTLHLPGARVRAARSALVVDGRSEPHLLRAQQRARAVRQLLAAAGEDVPVRAVVVVLGTERLALPLRSRDVVVLRVPVLVRWLRRQPRVLDAATTARLAAALHGSFLDSDSDSQLLESAGAFEALHVRVRAADRLRRGWFVASAVAGSTAVTTALAVLTS